MCLNEWCHILILFGAVVGGVNYISKSNNQLYCLKFPTVHQARFLSIKCNLSQIVMQSCKLSARILQYFLVFYYIVGFVTRGFVAELLRANESEGDVMSIFNVMEILMLGWTLWLSGSILLLLHNISWHLFNVYVTKMYPFPVDSIFPEDKVILLTSNLGSNQPILVQHLAFQYLSDVASSSAN
uniref:Nucleoporin NDC1 n=1 Tax=Ciona savignyi TaxID=51511 RepID=H2YNX7_CIOSA